MWRMTVMLTVLLSSVVVDSFADDAQDKVRLATAKQFEKLDRNNDSKLSLDEFQVFVTEEEEQAKLARRDFRLFDVDANSSLDLDEFRTMPLVVPNAGQRGPLPDPMQALVETAVATMDKTFADWNETPGVTVDVREFITAFVASIGNNVVRPNFREADPNQDQKVTREEARRFLEIQLGVRRSDGKLLREPNGRVINYMLYSYIDLNGNDRLERAEFLERSFTGAAAAAEFEATNRDGDDSLSFEEFSTRIGDGILDPVMDFRQMDTNFDTRVDLQELQAGTPEWKWKFASSSIPAFDLDRNGALSLDEYRLTMTANMILPWHAPFADQDGDGTLMFSDFKFDPQLQFPLLRFVYFHWLDQNGDRLLEPKEFWFKTKTPDEFFVMNADGSGWRKLFEFEGYPACGSPAVSPDGKSIAFDAWRRNTPALSTIFVMNIDGGDPHRVCSGSMPTWSKDGQLLACSRNAPAYGAWMMKADGAEHKHIHPGWGAQWSPDGKKIAFTEGNVIKAYDVGTDSIATLFDGESANYREITWNMTWSPDSERLCFKAIKEGGIQDVALVGLTGTSRDLKVVHSGKTQINADFAWHPTEDRVVFAMTNPERGFLQLYEFNPNKSDPPQLVKGQDPARNNTDVCWTPDGKRLIVITGDY